MKTIESTARVAVYNRRSRDEEGVGIDEALKNHRQRLQVLVKEREFKDVEWFEEVASGGYIDGRPEFMKMLSNIESGRYDVVVVIHEDRLSRGDESDRGRIKNAFKSTGTLLLTIDNMIVDYNDPQDVLKSGIQGVFSEYEKARILRRFKDGKIVSVQNGRPHSGTVAYGYFWNKNTKTADIIESEYEVIRMMVDWYLNKGLSGVMIADKLNELKIPAKRGGLWHSEVVTTMLQNEFYTGIVYYQKYKSETLLIDGLRHYTNNLNKDLDTVIKSQGVHTPIITEFEHAEILKRVDELRRYKTKDRRVRKNTYRLSGLVYCPHCGKCQGIAQSGNRRTHVRKCLKKSKTRTSVCDVTRGIAEDHLFDAVIADLQSYKNQLFEPNDEMDVESEKNSLNQMIRTHEAAIAKATKHFDKVKEMFMNDIIDMDEMKVEKQRHSDTIRRNEAELSELKQSRDFHDDARKEKQRKLWTSVDIEGVFMNRLTNSEINDILRMFIVNVRYEYTKDNEVNVDIVYR